jgi:glycosyltransferase involved in cell wall biosynthesis
VRSRRSRGRAWQVGERVVRGVANRLPPDRAAALIEGAKAGYALITGQRTRRGISAHREPRIDTHELGLARRQLEAGEQDLALARIDALHARYPDSVRVLQLRRDILTSIGDLSRRAETMHAMHLLDEQPEWIANERRTLGRIIETTPGWLPDVPGPARPVDPVGNDVVLHLLKESSPYLTNGFTMRSRYNLLAARDAGMRPVVVTALGFPRLLGGSGAGQHERLEMVDDIPHHRLDLGPWYDLDGPVDRILEDQAWLSAAVARDVRPAVIHASSGHRGFEHALVGQALRAHIQRPLVYEVRSFFESVWSADDDRNEQGEQYHRRFDAETRAMQAADHVITIAESMRAEIVERGIDPDHVTVIPNGVDAEIFTPRPPEPRLQEKYGLKGTFAFGYVSSLDHPRENQELLIEATRLLLGRHRRVRCLIIGDGQRREELEAAARKAGVAGEVLFTGRIPHDEVPEHYAILDAFVVPRKDERAARMVTPLKPYEALAMGRPLIVADLPALVEIAEPDERGLAFTAGSAAALADAVERLMDDPALAARIGEAGRAWVVGERSWSANGGRFRDVYERVLAEWPRGGR